MYISVKMLKTLTNYPVMLRLVSDVFPMLILDELLGSYLQC